MAEGEGEGEGIDAYTFDLIIPSSAWAVIFEAKEISQQSVLKRIQVVSETLPPAVPRVPALGGTRV